MNEKAYWYAFLSAMFSKSLDERTIDDFINNKELLEMFDCEEFFKDKEAAKEALNIDFTTTLIVNSPPIEAYIKTLRESAPTGLDNEAVAFYRANGYDIYLNKSELNAPDHLAIELGFMQALCLQNDTQKVQKKFLQEHILPWVAPYLIGIRSSFDTPFYRNLCNLTIEFIYSHYEELEK